MKDVPLCGKHEFGSIDDRQVMVVCLYICLFACIVVELVFSAAPSTCACFFLMRWVLNCIGCLKKRMLLLPHISICVSYARCLCSSATFHCVARVIELYSSATPYLHLSFFCSILLIVCPVPLFRPKYD